MARIIDVDPFAQYRSISNRDAAGTGKIEVGPDVNVAADQNLRTVPDSCVFEDRRDERVRMDQRTATDINRLRVGDPMWPNYGNAFACMHTAEGAPEEGREWPQRSHPGRPDTGTLFDSIESQRLASKE